MTLTNHAAVPVGMRRDHHNVDRACCNACTGRVRSRLLRAIHDLNCNLSGRDIRHRFVVPSRKSWDVASTGSWDVASTCRWNVASTCRWNVASTCRWDVASTCRWDVASTCRWDVAATCCEGRGCGFCAQANVAGTSKGGANDPGGGALRSNALYAWRERQCLQIRRPTKLPIAGSIQ
jgi:hypothetical protein